MPSGPSPPSPLPQGRDGIGHAHSPLLPGEGNRPRPAKALSLRRAGSAVPSARPLSDRRGERVGVRGAAVALLLIAVAMAASAQQPGDDAGDTQCLFDCAPADEAQEDADTLPERLRLYDDKGRRTGRLERDPVFEGRLGLYDEAGRRTGRVEEDPVFDGRYRIYDAQGRRDGHVEKDPVFEGRYRIYDSRGRKIGEVRPSGVFEGRYEIFDERGRRTGRVEEEP